MHVVVTMPVKNEAWILGASARAVMDWADDLLILDHDSTDETLAIAEEIKDEFPGRVAIFFDSSQQWEEMRHRQSLLENARLAGASHIAIIDADEILSANLIPEIRSLFEQIQGNQVLQLPWVCLARSLDRFYSSGAWFNNWVSCGFKDSPATHWAPQGTEKYDFHHRQPMGRAYRPSDWFQPVSQVLPAHGGGLMHLQFVNERRLRAKQALYKITEVLRWPGRESVQQINAKYNRAVYESDPKQFSTAPCPAEWWQPYSHLMKYVDLDREPWQEKRLKELVAANPGATAGLDLFGVV
jgi:glycosyltransferase involved in cell wall biosynthesis